MAIRGLLRFRRLLCATIGGLTVLLSACASDLDLGRDRAQAAPSPEAGAAAPPSVVDGGRDPGARGADAASEVAPFAPGARVACGSGFCCGIDDAGGLKCWGRNGLRALGNDSNVDSAAAVVPKSLAGTATWVAARASSACAVVDGGAYCWGEGRGVPTAVEGLGVGVVSVTVGRLHACALLTSGKAKCWGGNDSGQLGAGTTSFSIESPRDVLLPLPATSLAAGSEFTCALLVDGTVSCWGSNHARVLGSDAYTFGNERVPTPVAVTGLSGVVSLAVGNTTACALHASEGVKCWGTPLGSPTQAHWTPIDVAALVPGGTRHMCGVAASGAVRCWGQNGGAFGDGTRDGAGPSGPANERFVALGAGASLTCGLAIDGAMKCWGQYLGDVALTPFDVAGW